MSSDELAELLRKSHRAELLPLARELRIKPQGMGLNQLADAIARTLRRRGANDAANILRRRGEGPSYAEVLRALATRQGVAPAATAEETEARVVQRWVERAWQEMPPSDQRRLWDELQLTGPIPEVGSEALERVRHHHEARTTWLTGPVAASLIIGRVVPPVGCLAMVLLLRPRDERLIPMIIGVHRLRQLVKHRVTVGVVGSPSSGKDAAIRALFGIDSANISPIAGSTTTVEITRLPNATALYVVNTPGLGDVVESVTEEARQVLDHIDVYLYVVNAQGGVQAREKADWDAVRATGRPALAIINKIDTLREADRAPYLADARAKLQAPPEDFLAAAFDPLPQLADAPLGIEAVRSWLERTLAALGKDLDELPWRTRSEPPIAPPAPRSAAPTTPR